MVGHGKDDTGRSGDRDDDEPNGEVLALVEEGLFRKQLLFDRVSKKR